MHKTSCLCISASLVLLAFSLFLSISEPCLAQSSAKSRVDALYNKFEQFFKQRHYQEATRCGEELVKAGERAFGKNHTNVAIFIYKLAECYRTLGDYAKAEPLYNRALAIWEKALGRDHPHVAMSLNNLAQIYKSLGDYSKAESLLKRALDIREKTLGPDHPNVATCLNNLADLYHSLGNYEKAEFLYGRSLTIREKVLGPDHPRVATSLNNLAGLYKDLGDYAKAEPLFRRALAINEKAFGPDHPRVAICLNNLAALYQSLGNYAKSEPLFRRSLAIFEKALGPDHPRVATCLNNLALLYQSLGEYGKAEPLFRRSLGIFEKTHGPDHPRVATSLNNMADLYKDLGDYAKAEPLFRRSLAIREKALGPDHHDMAGNMNDLAQLYKTLSDYTKAESLFRRSLAINEKALGPNHPNVANSLNNLADLYNDLGDYGKAEPLFRRSLAINEKALGPDHHDVAISLNNLAQLYNDLGDYGKAEPLFRRSLAINEKVLSQDHPDMASCLNNLAMLYDSLGDCAKAEPLFRRALAINEKAFGPDHPDVAISLSNLAVIYASLGDYAKAEPLFRRSLAINEKALGPDHPRVATSLSNLAVISAALSDFRKAHKLNKRVQVIDNKLIDQVMGFTSEDQKIKFLSSKRRDLYVFLSLVNQHLRQISSYRKDALDVWLKRKGVILEAQRRFQEALVYSDDLQAVKTFLDLSRIRARLSKLAFSGPGKEGVAVYKEKIADLKAQKDRLEARLSKLSQAFALNQKITKADSEKVAGALPENTVLIEFARVMMFNFKGKGKEKRWLPAHYIAFVLHAGNGDKIGMVDLGNAGEIDKEITRLKRNIFNLKDIKRTKVIKSSKRIYALVIKPLEKELGSVKKVFISPDGNLNLIPFEILQSPDGKFLIENYTLNYLGAGRDILGFGEIKAKGNKALLIGDPDYDLGADEKDSTSRNLGLSKGIEKAINRRSTDMRGLHFKRLIGTKEEVVAIHMLLGKESSELYTGKEALEELLRKEGRPSILHLATHGFFLDDLELESLRDDPFNRGTQMSSIVTTQVTDMKIKIENPLIRSGIALAGANNALKTQDPEKSDGIVTAEKILGLRLRGTDMVVLSACETGIGEVKAGEGVFGLRRAFTQAGAKSLIMSMWSVPDKETKELMIQFYKNIQSGKMSSCQALRQAALKERKIVKKRYGHTNPLFWGAFVFLGEP